MQKALSKFTQLKLEKLLANVGDMSLKRRARRLIEELNPKEREKIIDLGCGTGYYLFLLSNLPVRLNLTGFDYDVKALAEAKTSLSGKNIELISGDLHKMPFKDNSFDKVVISEVLEHLENDSLAIKEIFRIIKPGGVMVVSVPSINYPFFWDPINYFLQHLFKTHIKKGFFSGLWSGHLRLYLLSDLRKKTEKAGFKIEVAEELTYWCLPFNHYIVNLVARLLYDVKISPKIA
ncbi:MAG: class I SAM-dependent methyltransferase, partial [Actinobacteria bacterium]|nr:class I SAM-dependent methyltransferase [Actinomycetota bacterium]